VRQAARWLHDLYDSLEWNVLVLLRRNRLLPHVF